MASFSKYGGWLPADPEILRSFLEKHVRHAETIMRSREPYARRNPAVQVFEETIKADEVMKYLFDQIFLQASEENKIHNLEMLLVILDHILLSPPPFHAVRDPETGDVIAGVPIGVPIYAVIFDLLSNTSAAYDLFRLPRFNTALKKVLDSWGRYLSDPNGNSNESLHSGDEGWFSKVGLQSLDANLTPLNFDTTYHIPDPEADNRGYKTWDEFFVRTFRDETVRPIQTGGPVILLNKEGSFIHSACESTVYRMATNVKLHDQFWLKDQKYSLYDMLNRDKDMAAQFEGGTVYQAFLSPQDYHRWHAPVDGTIEKCLVVQGSYYAVLPDEGTPHDDPDLPAGSSRGAIIRSQAFLNVVATRALIYIKADNPDIGLVCFIGVGMVEVSSCHVTVEQGQRVKTGDQLGMFHFGGSSHSLIFGPKCEVVFVKYDKEGCESKIEENDHIWVNSIIAAVVPV